jgi:hypothetical protein
MRKQILGGGWQNKEGKGRKSVGQENKEHQAAACKQRGDFPFTFVVFSFI